MEITHAIVVKLVNTVNNLTFFHAKGFKLFVLTPISYIQKRVLLIVSIEI